jgi:hypothetical protein
MARCSSPCRRTPLMSDDLVERVALAFCGKDAPCKMCRNDAKKAIVIALEEAADAVSEVGDCAEAGAYIAAIRAMIPTGTIPAQDGKGNAE